MLLTRQTLACFRVHAKEYEVNVAVCHAAARRGEGNRLLLSAPMCLSSTVDASSTTAIGDDGWRGWSGMVGDNREATHLPELEREATSVTYLVLP